ncbi:hypothetical protein D3C71_277420 [compost metagenome]
MQLAAKIVEDLRDFSSIVTNYGYQPMIVPARRGAVNHVIQFLDGAGRTHLVSVVVPKSGEVWSDAAVATARIHSEKIGATPYVFEMAYSRPDDVEPLRRIIASRADDAGNFRGKKIGVDVPEHYPQVARYIDAVEDAFRRVGQAFHPIDSDDKCVVTNASVKDVLAKLDKVGQAAGNFYSLGAQEGAQSGRLSTVRLSRGDGLEVEAAVTAYGFVVCSMSHGDDYREFDVSDVRRFPEAIDEFVAEMIPVPAAAVPA